ncbi:MAG: tetratricopeptide repeat protein [Treponemataceae bacterium]|nr:tetratricopeptide repeat protein [Treponemataceae bacterium]
MALAQGFLDRQDFEGALREYQKVLSLSGKSPPGDEALFQMGMIHAHYGNPKRDYPKSLALLRRMVREYPQSPKAEQAKLVIGLLQENERLAQTLLKLQQTLEETKKVDLEIEEKKKEKLK